MAVFLNFRPPALSYMLGAIETEEQKGKVQRQRQPAEPKNLIKNMKAPTRVTEQSNSRSEEDRVEVIVNSIHKQLQAECRKSKSGRVGYFDFALDPSNFGQSVENMFHISFLVKNRKVITRHCSTFSLLGD